MRDGLTIIPRRTKVLSSLKAAFPTTGLIAGDLSFATDEQILYRWSGAAWSAISSAISAGVPTGAIIMWSGLLTAIPTGWALCDGGGGRPDLRSRFIQGAAAGVDPGAMGGATAKTTAGHDHGGATGSHNHGGATGSHDHGGATGQTDVSGANGGTGEGIPRMENHTHTIAGATATIAGATATISSATDSIADIRPLFYDLAFIIKT